MPMKTVPRGYVARSRIGKTAVTFYVSPDQHMALREIADFEGMTLGQMIMSAVEGQYGRKMDKILSMKLGHKRTNSN